MQKIASEKAIQKFNVENDDLIEGKGILLGFLVSILISNISQLSLNCRYLL